MVLPATPYVANLLLLLLYAAGSYFFMFKTLRYLGLAFRRPILVFTAILTFIMLVRHWLVLDFTNYPDYGIVLIALTISLLPVCFEAKYQWRLWVIFSIMALTHVYFISGHILFAKLSDILDLTIDPIQILCFLAGGFFIHALHKRPSCIYRPDPKKILADLAPTQ